MVQKNWRTRLQDPSGFTLVELLVVMLIIGLLAAIAIPSFFNQRDKAKDASAKEAVRTAQTAIETYSTDNNGSYAGATVTSLTNIESSLTDLGARLTVTPAPTANTYTVNVTAKDTTGVFTISRAATGVLTYTCSPTTYRGKGGCPTSGSWN